MFPVDLFRTTLAKWVTILSEHAIRFHVTGGLTGTAYGEPRMTQDIDIVIDPMQSQCKVNALIQSIANSDFLYSEDSIRHAIEEGGMFQVLDKKECLKLDIYPREMIAGELDRSELVEIFEGEFIPIVCRTDAAASKLIWIQKGSHKSRRDLRAIFRNCNATQKDIILKWAKSVDLGALLDEVLLESDEIT